ncbi:hypothetical protein ACHEXK_12840 [Limnohabitans sp. DCL3]|uniref:hypothetical protein n=1 Tax=Limnohabitans sp. DCL3 TaxID=3374103 RepID=UPI003A874E14
MRTHSFQTPVRWAWALIPMWVWGGAAQAQSQPQLSCQVTYAGVTQTVVARPVADPYPVPSVDIGGRFWFKPIMVGTAQKIERIAIYSYLDTPAQPILVHQVKYLPPFPATQTAWPITGQNHVYGGPLERELIYSCQLEGWAP